MMILPAAASTPIDSCFFFLFLVVLVLFSTEGSRIIDGHLQAAFS